MFPKRTYLKLSELLAFVTDTLASGDDITVSVSVDREETGIVYEAITVADELTESRTLDLIERSAKTWPEEVVSYDSNTREFEFTHPNGTVGRGKTLRSAISDSIHTVGHESDKDS